MTACVISSAQFFSHLDGGCGKSLAATQADDETGIREYRRVVGTTCGIGMSVKLWPRIVE
jgi:hypothetical protein